MFFPGDYSWVIILADGILALIIMYFSLREGAAKASKAEWPVPVFLLAFMSFTFSVIFLDDLMDGLNLTPVTYNFWAKIIDLQTHLTLLYMVVRLSRKGKDGGNHVG